jgi:hypothetical protein
MLRRTRPVVLLALSLLLIEGRPVARPASADGLLPSAAPLFIHDVEAAFRRIQVRGEHLVARANGLIPKPRYRATLGNLYWIRNHFQGIQRLPNTRYLFLSGANPQSSQSDLFIIRLPGENAGGSEESGAEVVKHVKLDTVMWHAGGLSILGTTLAVPLHGGHPRRAKVAFFDVSDPENPRRLAVEIDRPGRKASATAITRLPNGHVLVAVMSAFDGLPRRVDFYLSRMPSLEGGFFPAPATWLVSEVEARPGQKRTFSFFQSINFVQQSDGRLFMVGFHNSFAVPASLPGRDYADLYELEFPEGSMDGSEPRLEKPRIIKTGNRQLRCTDGFCNLDAAAGLFIDPASQSLSVYAAPGWLSKDSVKITIYPSLTGPIDSARSTPSAFDTPRTPRSLRTIRSAVPRS